MDFELLDLKGYHQGLANDQLLYAHSLIETCTDEVCMLYPSPRKLLDGGVHALPEPKETPGR